MTVRVHSPQQQEAVKASCQCVEHEKMVESSTRQRNAGRDLSAVRPLSVDSHRKQSTYLFARGSQFSFAFGVGLSAALKGVAPALLLKLWMLKLLWVNSSFRSFVSHPWQSIGDWFRGVSPRKAAIAAAWSVGAFGAQITHAQVLEHDQLDAHVYGQAECAVDVQRSLDTEHINPGFGDLIAPLEFVQHSVEPLACPVARSSGCYVVARLELAASPRGPPLVLWGDVTVPQRMQGFVWREFNLAKAGFFKKASFLSFINLKEIPSRIGQVDDLANAAFLFIAKEQQA